MDTENTTDIRSSETNQKGNTGRNFDSRNAIFYVYLVLVVITFAGFCMLQFLFNERELTENTSMLTVRIDHWRWTNTSIFRCNLIRCYDINLVLLKKLKQNDFMWKNCFYRKKSMCTEYIKHWKHIVYVIYFKMKQLKSCRFHWNI